MARLAYTLLNRRVWEVVGVAESRDLQAADRLLAPALTTSLAALDLADEDQAAAKLAESYARALDSAAGMEAQARKVLRDAAGLDEDLLARVEALTQALGARKALAEIGPKLTALLVELGATPKARAALSKGRPPESAPDSTEAGLLSLVQGVPPGA